MTAAAPPRVTRAFRFFLYVLVFLQPFNHFNALRIISLYGLLFLFLLRVVKYRERIGFSDPTVIGLGALAAWSFVSSVLGPYPLESLNAMRKTLIVEVLLFLAIFLEFRTLRELKPLLWVAVSGFSVVTGAAFLELAGTGFRFQDFLTLTRETRAFAAGYANSAGFYLPFVVMWLAALADGERPWKRWIGYATIALGIVLVVAYDSRTALVAVPLAILLILLLNGRLKALGVGAVVIAALLSATVLLKPDARVADRFHSLTKGQTYVTNTGLSGRLGIWTGVWQLIQDRPWLGYGYGWKKLAWVVRDSGYPAQWKTSAPDSYDYFVQITKLRYGAVNPHNLPLQIMFEIGLVGLALFLWLWGTVISRLPALIRRGDSEARGVAFGALGILAAYALYNVTNGFWGGIYGNMMMVLMAVVCVAHRQTLVAARTHVRERP
jgi:O-antigen ligase